MYLQPYRLMMFVGTSMAPTYQSHSVLLTEPVKPDQLTRGMVVIINMDSGPIVKRIAYLPGDKILQAKFGKTWADLIYVHPSNKKSLEKLTSRYYIVPAGQVYVLGDNQAVSCDSRQFGCVSTSRIKKKLVDQRVYHRFADVPAMYLIPPRPPQWTLAGLGNRSAGTL